MRHSEHWSGVPSNSGDFHFALAQLVVVEEGEWAGELPAPVGIVVAPVVRLVVAGPMSVEGFRALLVVLPAVVGLPHLVAGN